MKHFITSALVVLSLLSLPGCSAKTPMPSAVAEPSIAALSAARKQSLFVLRRSARTSPQLVEVYDIGSPIDETKVDWWRYIEVLEALAGRASRGELAAILLPPDQFVENRHVGNFVKAELGAAAGAGIASPEHAALFLEAVKRNQSKQLDRRHSWSGDVLKEAEALKPYIDSGVLLIVIDVGSNLDYQVRNLVYPQVIVVGVKSEERGEWYAEHVDYLIEAEIVAEVSGKAGIVRLENPEFAPLSFFRHINRWLDFGLAPADFRYFLQARTRRKSGQVIPFDVCHYFTPDEPMAIDFPAAIQIWTDLRVPELDLQLPVLRAASDAGFTSLEETIACIERIWREGAAQQKFLFELEEVRTKLIACRN